MSKAKGMIKNMKKIKLFLYGVLVCTVCFHSVTYAAGISEEIDTEILVEEMNEDNIFEEDMLEIEEHNYETGEISTTFIENSDDKEWENFLQSSMENVENLTGEGNEGSAQSIIGSDDRNIISNTTRYPYKCIGKIEIHYKDSNNPEVGTGTLVANNVVLTAAHVLTPDSTRGEVSHIYFYPGRNGSETNGVFTISRACIPKKYTNAATDFERDKYDYAVGILSLGANKGKINLGGYGTAYNFSNILRTQATLIGYPAGRGSKMYRHKGTIDMVSEDGAYLLYYQMDSEGGQSGAPLIRYDNGNYYIVGIHIKGATSLLNMNKGRYITKNIYDLVNKYS